MRENVAKEGERSRKRGKAEGRDVTFKSVSCLEMSGRDEESKSFFSSSLIAFVEDMA